MSNIWGSWVSIGDRNWSKRCELLKAIEAMNLTILSTEESMYWPSDNKKNPDLDFSIISGISKDYCRTESCLELSSDHSPVTFTINSKVMTKSCTLCNAEQNGPISRSYWRLYWTTPQKIDDYLHITCTIEGIKCAVQQAVWSATPTNNNPEINIEYSSAIKKN